MNNVYNITQESSTIADTDRKDSSSTNGIHSSKHHNNNLTSSLSTTFFPTPSLSDTKPSAEKTSVKTKLELFSNRITDAYANTTSTYRLNENTTSIHDSPSTLFPFNSTFVVTTEDMKLQSTKSQPQNVNNITTIEAYVDDVSTSDTKTTIYDEEEQDANILSAFLNHSNHDQLGRLERSILLEVKC